MYFITYFMILAYTEQSITLTEFISRQNLGHGHG